MKLIMTGPVDRTLSNLGDSDFSTRFSSGCAKDVTIGLVSGTLFFSSS